MTTKRYQDYTDLRVWQVAHQLAMDVYQVTKSLPSEELYGITSQLRRAALSIPTNIAEGYGRGEGNDYARFLTIARGSVQEVHYLLYFARENNWIGKSSLITLHQTCKTLAMQLSKFISTLKKS